MTRKIFGATVIVTLMTSVGGSMAFFVRELLVASWFGTSDPLEAFIIALLVPTFVIDLVRSSIGSAVVPAILQAEALCCVFVGNRLNRVAQSSRLLTILLLREASVALSEFAANVLSTDSQAAPLKIVNERQPRVQ